ncbi:hypothetical protein H8E88_16730 [candidate division KSB1 bacterium]|nr:hypothetical protein [candidate division KSB1 bacterium]MBL7093041.1 hypothetical protein [candidate division KSB1 bacterium]
MSGKTNHSSYGQTIFASAGEVSSESVSQRLEQFQVKLLKAQTKYVGNGSPDIQLYFEETQSMLNFARDNFEKGFLNVSNSCLKIAENYLDKCQ